MSATKEPVRGYAWRTLPCGHAVVWDARLAADGGGRGARERGRAEGGGCGMTARRHDPAADTLPRLRVVPSLAQRDAEALGMASAALVAFSVAIGRIAPRLVLSTEARAELEQIEAWVLETADRVGRKRAALAREVGR